MERNAAKLKSNIEACTHDNTPALFLETPELCHYVWKDYGGVKHYHRSPFTLAVCYNDTWLVRYLVTQTDCDISFTEVHTMLQPVRLLLICVMHTGLVGTAILLSVSSEIR